MNYSISRTHQSNDMKGVQDYLEKDGFLMHIQVKPERKNC